MMGMTWDPTISAGNVITIGFGVIALILAWAKMGTRIDMLDLKVANLEKAVLLVSQAIDKFQGNETELKLLRVEFVAIQKSHSTLHDTVESLRKGEGFIVGPRRGNIEGEWPQGSRIVG